MIVFLLIVAGLIFGSFINALVWRLHEGRDWVRERSECPHCYHQLAARDLVPVLSWLMLRGKCRYCRRPIPDSPLVELVLPALFLLSYVFWPEPLQGDALYVFGFWLVFLVGFVALAVYDFKWFLLPDVIVFPLIVFACVQILAQAVFLGGTWQEVLGSLTGAVVISGLFYLIFRVSQGAWIGFGDVKLGIVLGLLAGAAVPALLVLFVASLVGTLLSLPLVLAGKANRKSHLPFGPMLITGLIVVVLFGQTMIDWYTGLVIAV
jgi:leader peptidase (prepilin peptidase)/N-methyltransferase